MRLGIFCSMLTKPSTESFSMMGRVWRFPSHLSDLGVVAHRLVGPLGVALVVG
jgi:hypothetical protein